MKERPPSNPYVHADFDTLWEACQRRAGELMQRTGTTRTPEERASLALDTAHLLLAMAMTLRAEDVYTPSSIWSHERKNVVVAFGAKHERALRSVRYRTLVAAVDAVMGGDREFWLRDARVGDFRACDLALSSEEGLRQVLEHLQGLRRKR